MNKSIPSIKILTKENIHEIKTFLEENLNQEIDKDLILEIRLSKTLRKFFFTNLTPYISPDTNIEVRDYILSLNQ